MIFSDEDIYPWASSNDLNDALEVVMCAIDTLNDLPKLSITCSSGTDKVLSQIANLKQIESAIYDRLCDIENREEQRSKK